MVCRCNVCGVCGYGVSRCGDGVILVVANLIVSESLAGWHRYSQLPVCFSIQLVSADKTGTFGM